MRDWIRKLLPRRAVGGAITAPSTDTGIVPVLLSNGLVSHDGGRTWREFDPAVFERRVPKGLNPWKGMATTLHSHGVGEPCDDRCTSYPHEEA